MHNKQLYSQFFSPSIVGCANLKKLRRKSKTQFVKRERNTQNAIALLNYLKRIAPQQLTLRTQVFPKKFKKIPPWMNS
jgi:hypothetical protein